LGFEIENRGYGQSSIIPQYLQWLIDRRDHVTTRVAGKKSEASKPHIVHSSLAKHDETTRGCISNIMTIVGLTFYQLPTGSKILTVSNE
jgi:hypothetical protein